MSSSTLQDELVDLFTRLCGAPDDAALAAAADRALQALDAQLTSAEQ